jgi:hypothetical protein
VIIKHGKKSISSRLTRGFVLALVVIAVIVVGALLAQLKSGGL